eukprot:739377-Pleurochrysis_carterae.AAC.1
MTTVNITTNRCLSAQGTAAQPQVAGHCSECAETSLRLAKTLICFGCNMYYYMMMGDRPIPVTKLAWFPMAFAAVLWRTPALPCAKSRTTTVAARPTFACSFEERQERVRHDDAFCIWSSRRSHNCTLTVRNRLLRTCKNLY